MHEQEKNTQTFLSYSYKKMKSLKLSLTLNQWRELNRLQDSQSMLLVYNGPCREDFINLASKVNGQARDSDITLLPVTFTVKQLLRSGSVQVFLDEVYAWDNVSVIAFAGRMNSVVHHLSLVEVRGEWDESKKRGVLHCFN